MTNYELAEKDYKARMKYKEIAKNLIKNGASTSKVTNQTELNLYL